MPRRRRNDAVDEDTNDPVAKLPPEIAAKIMSQLKFDQIFPICALVSKRWREFVYSEQMWQEMIKREFEAENAGKFLKIKGSVGRLCEVVKRNEAFKWRPFLKIEEANVVIIKTPRRIVSWSQLSNVITNKTSLPQVMSHVVTCVETPGQKWWLLNFAELIPRDMLEPILDVLQMQLIFPCAPKAETCFSDFALMDRSLKAMHPSLAGMLPFYGSPWFVLEKTVPGVRFIGFKGGKGVPFHFGFPSQATSCLSWMGLLEAVVSKNMAEIERIVKSDASLVNKKDDASIMTALYMAAQTGNVEAARFLLEHGADPNFTARGSCNALTKAAMEGYEITKCLIENGADIHAKWEGWTALREAVHYGQYGASAQLLIRHGDDINQQNDESGETILTALLRRMDDDMKPVARWIIFRIVALGADLNAPNADGTTALDVANERGMKFTAGLLESLGAERGDRPMTKKRKF